MFIRLLYGKFGKLVNFCFNILNVVLVGNLPPLGSVRIIIEEQNRYLVIEQGKVNVVFPGGFMRWYEIPTQTVLREGREETGLRLKVDKTIGCYSEISTSFARMSTLTIAYSATVVDGELRSSVEGRPCWQGEAEVRNNLIPQQKAMFDDYLLYRKQLDTSCF